MIVRRKPLKKVNAKRRKRESLRAYGTEERRVWMTSRDCLTCGQPSTEERRSQQSHLRSKSGAGRKGDARYTIPSCDCCHKLYPQRSKWAERFPEWTDEALELAALGLDTMFKNS